MRTWTQGWSRLTWKLTPARGGRCLSRVWARAKAWATHERQPVHGYALCERSSEERGDEDGGDVVAGRDCYRLEPEKRVPRYPSTEPHYDSFEEHPEQSDTPQTRHMATTPVAGIWRRRPRV